MVAATGHQELDTFRGELLAHCYRMLGSFHEAEDLVQETLLRAWRSADRFDPEKASLRTWLHRIATNACLTALEGRSRRPLPSGLGPAGEVDTPLVPRHDIPWLQPFPDGLLGDPGDAVAARADLRLALVAAVQLLPPRQRAALLLREVVRLSAAEVAEVLESTVASVNSSLQRARRTLEESRLVLDELREPADPDERRVVERYVSAFEAADVAGLARLLAEDVTLEMPPVDLWLRGRRDFVAFMGSVFDRRGTGWRAATVQANGSTALAAYVLDASGMTRAHSLQLFEVSGGLVTSCVTFVDPALFEGFGLPPAWEEALR